MACLVLPFIGQCFRGLEVTLVDKALSCPWGSTVLWGTLQHAVLSAYDKRQVAKAHDMSALSGPSVLSVSLTGRSMLCTLQAKV